MTGDLGCGFAPGQGIFQSRRFPGVQTLAVGEVLELMVDLVPDPARVPGTALNGRILFTTNVSDRQTNADLRAGIGQIDVTWFLFRLRLILAGSQQTKRDLVAHVHHHRFPQINCGEQLSRLQPVTF